MPRPAVPSASSHVMFDIVQSLPEQIRKGIELARGVDIAPTFPQRVVICGMGGSAISGDLIAACRPVKRLPEILIVRDYHLPDFVGKGDLVVGVSYSGNTEETLSCFREGLERGCTLAGVSSGGALEGLCTQGGYPLMKPPGGLPPRGAVGYLFASLAMLLEAYGALAIHRDLEGLVGYLEDLREALCPAGPKDNDARRLAAFLRDRIPIVYATPTYGAVARRWQTQLNENAKVLAWHGLLPEMDHNELVGWSADDRAHDFAAVFLQSPEEEDAMERRLRITQDLMKGRVPMETLKARGDSLLERIFQLLYLGDFVSVYLAELRGVDPTPVRVIDELKARLARR